MDHYLPSTSRANSGEFESEISLPVRVRYARDASGHIELLHITAAEVPFLDATAPLIWTRLPLRERRALQAEAETHAES